MSQEPTLYITVATISAAQKVSSQRILSMPNPVASPGLEEMSPAVWVKSKHFPCPHKACTMNWTCQPLYLTTVLSTPMTRVSFLILNPADHSHRRPFALAVVPGVLITPYLERPQLQPPTKRLSLTALSHSCPYSTKTLLLFLPCLLSHCTYHDLN